VPLVGVVSSPSERCRQTSRAILDHQTGSPATPIERGITECDYGEWQGRELGDLAEEKLWSSRSRRPPCFPRASLRMLRPVGGYLTA